MSFHSAVQKQERTNTELMASGAFLQRKCDRGQHPFNSGEYTENHSQEQLFDPDTLHTLAASRFGHDFSRIPLHASEALPTLPLRQAPLMIQRFPRNEDEVSKPCPTCPEAESPEVSATAEPEAEQAPPAAEAAPTPAEAEPTAEPTAHEETPSPGLIVDDSAAEAGPGKMRKSEFLAQLRTEVTRRAEAALAGTGRTTADCPYLEYWFGYYGHQDSLHLERAIHRYAPETVSVATARDYIPIIAARVGRSVEVWARTGEITGVPEGASAVPPETAARGETPAAGDVQRKSRDGGVGQTGGPAAVKARLGPGHSLDSGMRSRMENAFGHDFSRVRVHTDAKAADLSRGLNARAFTVGSDVAFASGEYQPGTPLGDALITHELAHTIQQGATGGSGAQLRSIEAAGSSLEREADESAVGAVASLWGKTKSALTTLAKKVTSRARSGLRLQRCTSGDCPPGYHWAVESAVCISTVAGVGASSCSWRCMKTPPGQTTISGPPRPTPIILPQQTTSGTCTALGTCVCNPPTDDQGNPYTSRVSLPCGVMGGPIAGPGRGRGARPGIRGGPTPGGRGGQGRLPAGPTPPRQLPPGPPTTAPPSRQLPPGPPTTAPPSRQLPPGPPTTAPPSRQLPPGPPTTAPPSRQLPPGPPTTAPPSRQLPPAPTTTAPPSRQLPPARTISPPTRRPGEGITYRGRIQWGNPASVTAYGHSQSRHGAGRDPQQLRDRAMGTGSPQGQYYDNNIIVEAEQRAPLSPGPHDVSIGRPIGRVYMPDGSIIENVVRVRVLRRPDLRVETSFPIQ